MASFTPWSRRSAEPASWRVLLCILATLLALGARPAAADGIVVKQAGLIETEDGYALDAEFDIDFNSALIDVVNRGVALYFVLDLDVSRSRWYWLDERPITFQRVYKITYAPLVQHYRLQSGLYTQNFTRFEDLRRALSRIRALPVAERGTLRKGEAYVGYLRFRLDTSQLPKPLQISTVASRDWALNSEWQRLEVRP